MPQKIHSVGRISHSNPRRAILFGSYAYGQPHAESDVDLLVVMPAYNEIAQAIRIRRECKRPFALDLIVKTPKRLECELKHENRFLREVMSKGKVLYEASAFQRRMISNCSSICFSPTRP